MTRSSPILDDYAEDVLVDPQLLRIGAQIIFERQLDLASSGMCEKFPVFIFHRRKPYSMVNQPLWANAELSRSVLFRHGTHISLGLLLMPYAAHR